MLGVAAALVTTAGAAAQSVTGKSSGIDSASPFAQLLQGGSGEGASGGGGGGEVVISEVKAKPLPFARDSWTFQSYGSVTMGEDAGWMYQGHIGAGYYVFEGVSFNFEAVAGRIHASEEAGESGGRFPAGGFDLLLRWHALRNEDWSFYFEGGAGVLVASESFPANGTHFNFTPQLGFGLTVRVADKARLMVGARWHHVSNGRVYGNGRNPGYEGVMTYAGLMIPF